MLKTNLERIKAGISFFKLQKGKEDNSLVLKYFWEFISVVEKYVNGDNVISEPDGILEEAIKIFNSDNLPIDKPSNP
jgi:hypothetical protein